MVQGRMANPFKSYPVRLDQTQLRRLLVYWYAGRQEGQEARCECGATDGLSLSPLARPTRSLVELAGLINAGLPPDAAQVVCRKCLRGTRTDRAIKGGDGRYRPLMGGQTVSALPPIGGVETAGPRPAVTPRREGVERGIDPWPARFWRFGAEVEMWGSWRHLSAGRGRA